MPEHIQFRSGDPLVYPDFVFSAAASRKLVVDADGKIESPVVQQQPQITDVCERLYAEAVARRRVIEERVASKSRRLTDEAGLPDGATAADAKAEDVDPREYDPECTFKPAISADAHNKWKFENWDGFMQHRELRNKQAASRWEKKREQLIKQRHDKEIGEERKMAPMSEKLLAYREKNGEPHRGPVSNYDHYLGRFILKRTSPDRDAANDDDGDSAERRRRSAEYGANQRELTQRLYEDAVARVAARQVVERARIAADRAKLFQPMTNERLLAKLKELNPEHDGDGLTDDMTVENRLLSQGEAYRLRKERRATQHHIDATRDCTFTPRTNPHSRQLLQQWARRVEVTGSDPSAMAAVASVMRVDRNLADSQDYAPLNPGGATHTPRGTARIYQTEEEALAAIQAEQQQQQQSGYGGGNTNVSGKPRHIPDPEAHWERVKMRQLERERQLQAKRRQQTQAEAEGCTFRPSVAPLTSALSKLRDDKEFGPEDTDRAHKEILLPPHMRPPSAQWGEKKGSPRKLPRGAMSQQQQQQQYSSSYQQDQYTMSVGRGGSSSNPASIARRTSAGGAAGSAHTTPGSRRTGGGGGSAAASRLRNDTAAQDSEHFLADLEHELQGVISSWQSDGF